MKVWYPVQVGLAVKYAVVILRPMSQGRDHPTTDGQLTVPSEQLARQATASLAGHLFQAMRAASEWVQLSADARLLVEVAEDYAVLCRGALAMTQTKQEFSASVTLRSDGVRKSLAGLLAFQEKNPTLKVSLVYLTTAEPGKEAQSALPNGAAGIAYWREVARGADIAPLRQLLLDSQNNEKVLKRLREADDDTLRATLVQPVTWLTGSPALPEARAALEARLRALGAERSGYAADGERALPFVIYHILQTAVAQNRVLTRDDFEQEWKRATTVNVSFSMMRRMAAMDGMAGSVSLSSEPPPPALSARTALRRPLVDDLQDGLRNTDILWLHGSSGLGKSQLARLMAARGNGSWEFVALKDCDTKEQAARIRNAISRIAREDFAGLILDDVPVPAPEALREWIGAASLEISAIPSARIVVTSEREPLPQIRKAFEPLRLVVRAAPYLELDDVHDIVVAAGGDPETWAPLIHLTCGNGHPLLVDARVAGLASKGWPAGERLNGLGIGDGPSEIADVRREVSLRLLDELSPDAHRLLLRLSGLIGAFDRRMVDVVAAVQPEILRAGALLEYLVGPWIELKRTDRYGLSPLLTAATASLSETERTKVHTAAIEDLIKRQPFPGDLLSALTLYAMIVRHIGGFMFIGQAVINSPRRAELGSALFPLVYMKSAEGGLLVPEHPGVSAILRTAQVFAAVNSDPPSRVEEVVTEALVEAATRKDKLRGANIFTTLMAVLGNEGADLAPKVWMPMLVTYHNHLVGGQFPTEMTAHMDSIDFGGLTPEQMFFMVRSSKVDTVADVEELFGALEGVDPEWRHSLLTAAPTLLKGPPLFVQRGWSSETSTDTLDATVAETAYASMAERAIAWGEEEVAVECIRSRVVMLDEYLDQHEDALAVLDEADDRFGRNERLIRSRAAVLATMGRHAEELEMLSTLSSAYSEDEPLERLLMLRTAAISAAKVQQFARSAKLFHDAYAAATDEAPKVLGASVRPGLLVDAAIMEIRAGHVADALTSLVAALDIVSADRSGDASLPFAYSAITHVTQWAVAQIEEQPFPEDPSENPGVCSTLRPKFDPAKAEQREPNQEWYLLTRLEAVAGHCVGAETRLLECELVDGVQLKLAAGVTATQIQHYIARSDAASVLRLLPRYAWVSGLFVDSGGVSAVHAPEQQTAPDRWGPTEALAARAVVSGLLGMLIASNRSADAVQVATQARGVAIALAMLLPETEGGSINIPEVFSSGLSALRLLISETQLNAEELLRTSVDLFTYLKYVGAIQLNIRAHGIMRLRWLELARHRRAILSNPRLSVPEIEVAAASPPGIAGIARLIEAGCLGSSLGLTGELVEILRATK